MSKNIEIGRMMKREFIELTYITSGNKLIIPVDNICNVISDNKHCTVYYTENDGDIRAYIDCDYDEVRSKLLGEQAPDVKSQCSISLDDNISVLGLPRHTETKLYDGGIVTIGHLISKTPEYILDIHNMSVWGVFDVYYALSKHGLSLIEDWSEG